MAKSSSASLRDTLVHLKKKLERTTDEDAVLQIIHKLSKVPITTDLLQGTGAGKIIRTLSKKPGKIGQKASSLLNKWREIVAGSQNSNENLKQNHSSSNSKSVENHSSSKPHVKEKHVKEKHSKEKQISMKDNNVKDTPAKINNINGHLKDKHTKYKSIKEQHTSEKHSKEKHSKEKYLKESTKSSDQKYSIKESKHKYSTSLNEKFNSKNEVNHTDYSSNDELVYDPEKVIVKSNDIFNQKSSSEEDSVSYEPTPKKQKMKNDTPKEKMKIKSSSSDSLSNKISKKESPNLYKSSSQDSKSSENSLKKHKSLSSETDKPKNRDKSSNKHSNSKKSKKKLKLEQTEAFTSSETTFEDCLNFNDMVPLKKKKSSKPPSTSSSHKSSSKEKKSVSKVEIRNPVKSSLSPADHTSDQDLSDEMLEAKDFKKEASLQSTLPPTQPFYRPLPHKSYEDYIPVKKKEMSNEDAIKFTSSRREKTAVYSGRKNCYLTEVPSLFECCTRVLIEDIDGIEYMGEVPYFLLEPMLKRCTANQLYRIEHFNPSLLEDSDQLWEVHCRRDYRSAKPQENETWRELYLRTRDEREQRLRNVTANISASIANSNPVRRAKLAYIDSVVKPPRDVARRQAKHGTALVASHSVKPNSPVKISSSATPTPISPTPTSSAPPVTVVSSSKAREIKAQKPKIAPLMAKTLKSMKKCFRR